MPIIIACPSCGGKLRVSDELRGQLVRCPACNHTFDTVKTPVPAQESHPTPGDLPLELAIDEPSSEPRPKSNGEAPGLIGAIELKLSLDDEPALPRRTPQPPPPEPPQRTAPPRLADEHDDLKTCPVCGKHVHRDSTRCYNCGERFSGLGREPPSILRKPPRRDAEPDRGGMVLALGIISVVCISVCGFIGVVLGLIAWVMGQRDLAKMKRGDMDARNQGMTQAGWICGIIGTALNALWTLACLGYFGVIFFVMLKSGPATMKTTRPAVIKPAPVQQWPPNNRPPRRNKW